MFLRVLGVLALMAGSFLGGAVTAVKCPWLHDKLHGALPAAQKEHVCPKCKCGDKCPCCDACPGKCCK